MIDPLADHPLLAKLGRIMGAVIEETSEQRGGEFVQVREYLPHEDYGRTTLLATAEVQATLTQLTQATLFMANFRSTQQLKTHGISRFDHIVYHLENFLVRITGAFDRCLILVNVALDLGNEPEDCRYSSIKRLV